MSKKTNTWRPTASIDHLKKRAKILSSIRQFFAERNILEVETPSLCHSTIPDPHIESFSVPHKEKKRYLQTSPEFSMKRLLAAGSGPIYQLCKAFRGEESGRLHNPEFTLLEWYRPDFNHHDLMGDVDALLHCVLKTDAAERISYQSLFEKHFSFNPHEISVDALKNALTKNRIHYHFDDRCDDRDTLLNILLTHKIEPMLGLEKPVFIYDYPRSQSALAKINNHIAERFEVYYHGIELANGFHELLDASEQCARFEKQLKQRQQTNLPTPPLDQYFLDALAHGLPRCAGVALGVDRLIMLETGSSAIEEVLTFTFDNA